MMDIRDNYTHVYNLADSRSADPPAATVAARGMSHALPLRAMAAAHGQVLRPAKACAHQEARRRTSGEPTGSEKLITWIHLDI